MNKSLLLWSHDDFNLYAVTVSKGNACEVIHVIAPTLSEAVGAVDEYLNIQLDGVIDKAELVSMDGILLSSRYAPEYVFPKN